MSERYGSPGELKEIFEDLEDWLNKELDLAQQRNQAGRYAALRDVRDYILGNQ